MSWIDDNYIEPTEEAKQAYMEERKKEKMNQQTNKTTSEIKALFDDYAHDGGLESGEYYVINEWYLVNRIIPKIEKRIQKAYKEGYDAFDMDNDDKYLPKEQAQQMCDEAVKQFVEWYNNVPYGSDEYSSLIEGKDVEEYFNKTQKREERSGE